MTYKYEYFFGNGVGDLNIQAECMSLIPTSEKNGILRYLGKGSNLLNIKCFLGVLSDEIQIDDLLIYKPVVATNDYWEISFPNSFKITATVKKIASSNSYAYYALHTTSTYYDIGSLRQNGSITIRRNPDGVLIADNNTSIIPLNTNVELEYVYDNGTHTLSANGHIITATEQCTFNKLRISLLQSYSMTNLKVRQL